ncbi:O-antigen ligase [Frankia sp. Cj5]|uniref:O-antigen ligase family protein n=1 Tax=Frankia sp. Cj5 TaxID=2880978 RepID=UPI001EF6A268|nr:hypothetical protein [Frankia sp. Cj5]
MKTASEHRAHIDSSADHRPALQRFVACSGRVTAVERPGVHSQISLIVRSWPFLVVVAAFGPYLTVGVRTEQVMVYGSLLLAIPFLVSKLKLDDPHACVAILWVSLLLLVIVNANRVPVPGKFFPGNLLSGVDSYLYPLAVLLLVACWLAVGHKRLRLLNVVSQVFVVMVSLNGIIAFAGLFSDPTNQLQRFWGYSPATLETTVAVRALDNGRLTGIFAQPAEAGVAYSLALLAAVYLFGRHGQDRPVLLGLAVTPVLVGGVLSVSKIFLLVGLPLAVWQAMGQGQRTRRLLVLGCIAGLVKIFSSQFDIPQWRGSWMLASLFGGTGSTSVESKYTAGRLSSNGSFSVAFQYVSETHPWFGYGASGLAIPYDSSWIEIMVVGGFIGVAIFSFILVILIYNWLKGRPARRTPERSFATAVLLLSMAATMGIPAFTANRVALFIWIFLTLLILVDEQSELGLKGSVHHA